MQPSLSSPETTVPRCALPALVVLLAMALALPVSAQDDPPRGIPRYAERATARCIVDGDTVRITLADGGKETVRLIGIDTPETVASSDPVGCYGPEASARLEELLPPGREVWLEADETDRDRYDRLLLRLGLEARRRPLAGQRGDGPRWLRARLPLPAPRGEARPDRGCPGAGRRRRPGSVERVSPLRHRPHSGRHRRPLPDAVHTT